MRIIISAGGTGGHIYPALSIVNKIKDKDKNAEILYVGTTDRMEKDIVPKYNIEYYAIKIRGIDRKLSLDNIRTVKYFVSAVKEMKKLMKKFKPDIVIGVGGYVTAPVIYAAHKLKIKTIIHEQNSILGMTNKFLSKYVDALCISFPDTKSKAKRVVYTGNPSSEDDKSTFDKKEFNLSNNKKLVLIVMGSLGSKVVNDKMKEILPKFNGKDYEVLFITGNDYFDEFNNLKLDKNIKIVSFVNNLKRVFKKTDVLVSRAGATTMSEIISFKVPSILIPSPYVTDNHQYKNAMSLVEKDSALLIEEKNLNSDILISNIEKLLNDNKKINSIKNNLSMMSINNSASKIYDLICEIVGE